jgi:hypothetical protein
MRWDQESLQKMRVAALVIVGVLLLVAYLLSRY